MSISLADRICGGLFGVAAGDALGAPLEFMTSREIRAEHGEVREMIGGGWLSLPPGVWTDDTDMTLAVAEGIVAQLQNPVQAIGEGFMRWRATNPPDIGITTNAAFRAYEQSNDWHEASKWCHERSGQTAGNGALMRTVPVALSYQGDETIFKHAMNIARMTHWDLEAGLTCALYCIMIDRLIAGEQDRMLALTEAAQSVEILLTPEMKDPWQKIQDSVVQPVIQHKSNDLSPTGYTVDSLRCALWAFVEHENLEECLVAAANLCGDADTIAAIAGGLAGVYWGFDAIPVRWLKTMGERQCAVLEKTAVQLMAVRQSVTGN